MNSRNEAFVANTPDRCYFCKKELFGKLVAIGRAKGHPLGRRRIERR